METAHEIDTTIPFLKNASAEVRRQFSESAVFQEFPEGQILFFEGDVCTHVALIVSGTVRVYKIGENGREITLYRISKDESCILNLSCLFSRAKFPAIAEAEEPVELFLVPLPVFQDWVNRHEIWRDYVFGLFSKRLANVIATVEEITFQRMDARVAKMLLHLSQGGNREIKTTHQEIATELGTAREVVSRILKTLEGENLVSLSRGIITVENLAGLKQKSSKIAVV